MEDFSKKKEAIDKKLLIANKCETEGLKLFSSHSFKEAKEVYLRGIQELIDVKKLTADDPVFNEKIKQ